MPTMVGVGEAPPQAAAPAEAGAAASPFDDAMREDVRGIVHAAVSDAVLAVEDGQRALEGRVTALEKEIGELRRVLAARAHSAPPGGHAARDSVMPPSALPTAPPRAAAAPAKDPTPPPAPAVAKAVHRAPALELTPLMPSVVPSVAPTVVPGSAAAAFAFTPPSPAVARVASLPPSELVSVPPPAVAATSAEDTLVTTPVAGSVSLSPPIVVELGLPSALSARPPRPSIPVESLIPAAPVSLGDVSELLDGARRRKRTATFVVLVLLLAVGAVAGLTIYSRVG